MKESFAKMIDQMVLIKPITILSLHAKKRLNSLSVLTICLYSSNFTEMECKI